MSGSLEEEITNPTNARRRGLVGLVWSGRRKAMNGCLSCVVGLVPPVKFPVSVSAFNVDVPGPPSSSASPTPSDSLYTSVAIGSRSRREAILGLSLGVLGFPGKLLNPRGCSAAEAPPLDLTVSPSGLAYFDKLVGSGPVAVEGQLIKVHYVGKLENGTVFDSSYSRGKPLTFRIGVGEVIKGWDKGILGGDGVPPMLAGGKRILKIPPELGYGMRGAGCRGGSCIIPPGSVLLFDVEFIGKA